MKKMIILDAGRLTGKAESHNYLKELFDFPDYYGGNLDALYDCLTELPKTEILIENTEEAGDYYPPVAGVIMEVAEENYNLTVIEIEEE